MMRVFHFRQNLKEKDLFPYKNKIKKFFSLSRKKYNKAVYKDTAFSTIETQLGESICNSIQMNFNINMQNHLKSKGAFQKPTFRTPTSEFFVYFPSSHFKIENNQIKMFLGNLGEVVFPLSANFQYIQSVKCIRFHTSKEGYYLVIEYYKEAILKPNQRIYHAAVDMGMDAIFAAYVDTPNPNYKNLIVEGDFIKERNAILKWKRLALKKDNPKAWQEVFIKHKRVIKEACTYATKRLFDYLAYENVKEVFIGDFFGVKKRHFASYDFHVMPFYYLRHKITDYSKIYGIKVNFVDESYTSSCSFLDYEKVNEYNANKARRVQRDLFITDTGIELHADLNGAGNTLAKNKGVIYDRKNILNGTYRISLYKNKRGKAAR